MISDAFEMGPLVYVSCQHFANSQVFICGIFSIA